MELRQIATTLWKWAWLIILATAVAAVSSWWVVKDQPPIYQTSTTLMVGLTIQKVNPDSSEFYTSEQLAQTYSELIRREPVLKATAAALGFEDQWPSLRGQVSAALVAGTELMEVRVVDTDPVRAKRIADEVARQLIATVEQARPQGSSREFIQEQVAALPPKIEATQEQIGRLQAELGQTFSAREIQDLENRINTLEQQVNDWRTTFAQYQLLLGDTGVNVLTVVEEAALPTHPTGSRSMMQVALAAVIGLMLAVGAAFLIEYLDDTVKSPQDVERATNLPTFGSIIRFPRSDEQGPLTALEPRSAIAEGYRVLRTNLQFASMGLGKSGAVLLVTSALPTEGKTTSLANLGVSLAQAGRRVLLVDTDLRRPALHKQFNISKEAGLTSLLLEREADVEHVVQKTGVDGLRVLPSGPVPANPAEVLGFAEMGALLERLRTMADYVLLDSPPVLSVTDASVLAEKVDGVLMVVEAGQTRTEMFKRAVAVLQGVKARVLGTILTKAGVHRGGYYYDYYYYSSYDTDEEGGVRKKRRRHREGLVGQLDRAIAKLFGRRRRAHAPGGAAPPEAVQVGTPSRVLGGASAAEAAPPAEEVATEAAPDVPALEAEGLPRAEEVVTEVAAGAPALEIEALPKAEKAVTEVAAGVPALEVEGLPKAEEVVPLVAAGVPALEIEALPKAEEAVAEVTAGAPALEVEGLPKAQEVVAEVSAGGNAVYAQAMEHYRNHEWAQARDALLRLKAADPARPDLDALLNDVERVMKHDRPRQRAKRQTSEIFRRRPRVRLARVVVLALLLLSVTAGALMYTGVLPMPSLSLPLLDNRVQTQINRGYDFFTVDNYEEAIQSFNKALELDPDNAEAKLGLQHATQYLALRDLYGQARALMEQKSFDAAIAKLQAIIKIDPWYKDADLLLSQCQRSQELEGLYEQAMGYYNAGDWAKAASAFEALQGQGVAEGEAAINSRLFDCYLNEGRRQIAAADSRSTIIRATVSFNSALALFPDDLVAQEERQLASLYLDGYTAYERADSRQVIANLTRICTARPDYAQGQAVGLLCASYTKLGDSYRANGQPQLALDQYRLVQTFAQCDQTEVSGKIQQVVALLGPVAPSPTAKP
jgi:capsular exopolysaccharide synthesis family protein